MAANLVCAPVLVTCARASPSTTKHPANTASPTSGCSGTLSPVSADVSTARPATLSTVASADIRSPSASSTTSPTTNVVGRDLLRHAVAQHGRPPGQHLPQSLGGMLGAFFLREREDAVQHDRRRRSQCPAEASPATNANPPATQNSSAKKWTISAARRRHDGLGALHRKAIGPVLGQQPGRLLRCQAGSTPVSLRRPRHTSTTVPPRRKRMRPSRYVL